MSFPSRLWSTWGFPPETSIAPKLCSTREICRKDLTLICRKIVRHPKLAEEMYLEVRAAGGCKGQMPTKKAQGLYGASYGQIEQRDFQGGNWSGFNPWAGRLARFQAQLLVSSILKDWLVSVIRDWLVSCSVGQGKNVFLWLWFQSQRVCLSLALVQDWVYSLAGPFTLHIGLHKFNFPMSLQRQIIQNGHLEFWKHCWHHSIFLYSLE